jgi:hypothetical protein
MSTMDVGINHRWSTASTVTSWHHFHSTVTQNYQNLFLYVQWTVTQSYQNLFIYVRCGCGKQSKVVISLNRDIMASFPFDSHLELPKSDPASALLQCKAALKCLQGKKTLYICTIWRWEAIKGGNQPNHGIMASFPLDRHPEFPKSDLALTA